VCLLLSGQLQQATGALEAGLADHPGSFMQEGLLRNLGCLLDLSQPGRGRDVRHSVAAHAVHLVPDDFDLTCLSHERGL
jgi:hypothetical protein